MTVRVTTLKGAGAGRYYTEHLPSYYLDGDEPPGHWWGRSAGDLGLGGQIDPDAFLAVMAGHDPATGRDLGRRYGDESVRGYDATFSAPKSVSVLFGLGDDQVRDQVVEAHERAVAAVLGWVEDHAHTRMRRHGHVMCVDAGGIVVGVFRQHTSRKLDPQLHTHAVIANRVRAPDGRWLALDARTIKIDQRTLSALYHVNLRSELTRRLGVAWRQPEHGIAEISGIDDELLVEFSQRTRDVERRLRKKLERFRDGLGRDPSRAERWRLEREAVVDSRPAKPQAMTAAEPRNQWRERTEALGRDPRQVVRKVIGRRRRLGSIDGSMAGALTDAAIAGLVGRQSTWRPTELLRELAASVPTTIAVDAVELTETLDGLTDSAASSRCVDISRPIPSGTPLRRDGRPITESAVDRGLTTNAILNEEEELLAWAEHRKEGVVDTGRTRPIRFHDGLTTDQTAAVEAVAGRSGLELIVGPAGAGKTTMLAAAVLNIAATGRLAFGVAPTAVAAEVLATETGMPTDTLDKLLTEHASPNGPRSEYDLPRGTTLIVDEAGTAATPKLAELARLADQQSWRVVLVGDHRQFSAVGRGGMFAHLVDQLGTVELDRIHRFNYEWERRASLRLRAGDPKALTEYQQRGRLHGGTLDRMENDIIAAWNDARLRGETVALMANSTDTVTRLNRHAQHTRIANGELDPTAPSLTIGNEWVLVGDEVVTRRNDRTLRTDQGRMVKNRDHWTISTIHEDRSVTLTGRTGTIRLPADYVAEHLQLGYAQTSHAAQGRTVDTALILVDTPTDGRGIYTPMTRGRNANHAYVVTEENQMALDVFGQAIARDWIDMPAVDRRAKLDHRRQRHSTGRTDGGELGGLDGSNPPAQRHPTTVRSSNRQAGLSLGH